MIAKLAVSIDVAAPAELVFASVVDLPSQDRWMLGTTLFALGGDVAAPDVGSQIAALTGVAGVGVLDTMVVTDYDPPHRWATRHTGKAFRGAGIFTVEVTPSGSRVTWAEEIDLPFGILGRVGWRGAKPLVRWGLAKSLRTLADGVLDGSLPVNRPRTTQ